MTKCKNSDGHEAAIRAESWRTAGERGLPYTRHFTPRLSRPAVGMDTITCQVQFEKEWVPFYTPAPNHVWPTGLNL